MAFLLTFCLQHLKPDVTVWVESENGILGMGPYPSKDEVDAYVLIDYVAPLTVLDDVLNVAVISSTPERRPPRFCLVLPASVSAVIYIITQPD